MKKAGRQWPQSTENQTASGFFFSKDLPAAIDCYEIPFHQSTPKSLMENSDDKSQPKPNPLRKLWPDVRTEKGRREAIKAGAIALAYIAVSYAIVAVLVLTTGRDLMGALDGIEFATSLGLDLVAIVAASLMAWFFYKRESLVIACIGVIWIALEVAMKLVAAPGRGTVVALLALLFSINGVRGALVARKALQPTLKA
ncbi:hypothetical protein [Microvirga sp. M2]|uniref:hypothetical protein n=1 Tax=Microvirga sp. M2 TaxID=3073270 RepID=UPI0039C11B3B